MSLPQPDVPVAWPHPALRPRPDTGKRARAAPLQRIRALSHYRPDYAYQPDRYQYTETHTSDPHYVVFGVRMMMSPSHDHGEWLVHMYNALKILGQSLASTVHVSMEVNITGIPGALFGPDPHTSTLQPDLSLWTGPAPDDSLLSYRYDRDGVPLLTVEIVSHSDRELRDNDWRHKMAVYAGMGIREYWLVDQRQPDPLSGFTLDAAEGTPCRRAQYRPIGADADGGMDSMVLNASLRWADDGLQCWQERAGAWVRVEEIPVLQAALEGALASWDPVLHHLLDATDPDAAEQVLQSWAATPPSHWPSQDTLDRLAAVPGAWRHLLLGGPQPQDTGG